jgi:D-tyrosyl-tRNA(Tyr) deacylase
MKAVVQRVSRASVTVDGTVTGSIGPGLCVLVGVTHGDTDDHAARLAERLWGLRIMADDDGVMNVAVGDAGGELLVVSQFTLYGDMSRGRRPSWRNAAPGPVAEPLVTAVVTELRRLGATVATGVFGADMDVELVNDGPVTVLIEV